MNEALSDAALLALFELPEADRKTLSFCKSATAAQVAQWIDAQPLTQTSYVSAVLYAALPELIHLKTDGQNHIDMLDQVRPAVQAAIQGLSKAFLHQPLILPEAARKAAVIAQALQKHLSNAYLRTVHTTFTNRCPPELRALAIHRTLTGLGLLLLRSYQLYTPTLKRLWREVHTLYLLAERHDLTELHINDPLTNHQGVKTITQAYLRILLLATAHPNQLGQNDLYNLYLSLESLSLQAQLHKYNEEGDNAHNGLYAIMLDNDSPPVYRSRLKLYNSQDLRLLDTDALCKTLQNQPPGTETRLSSTLIGHILPAWQHAVERSYPRHAGDGSLEVTVGLSNVHFYSANETPFSLYLKSPSELGLDGLNQGIFKQRGLKLKDRINPNAADPWGEAFDVAKPSMQTSGQSTLNLEDDIRRASRANYQGQHPIDKIAVIDASAGGYCLEWRGQSPATLKAGELLGVREPGRQKWGIAAVRWVQQSRSATQIGIQLLAPQAQPAAAAIVQKTGEDAEYLRVLALPALRLANQPASLLTNAVSFRELQKIKLYQNGVITSLQLTRRLFSTGIISQFAYKVLANAEPPKAQETHVKTDFSALWDSKE
ncbi:hypothetical protein [Gilvimarinus polysaccharolyticus]|uniref:hypothetical protein n=1 Tax=Gilvimarinus polysaccharolyticus TaxID=863921 RepID=UPI0006731104|nr:hypothetical protein [Gilvimarinus polysaccharolyticus]